MAATSSVGAVRAREIRALTISRVCARVPRCRPIRSRFTRGPAWNEEKPSERDYNSHGSWQPVASTCGCIKGGGRAGMEKKNVVKFDFFLHRYRINCRRYKHEKSRRGIWPPVRPPSGKVARARRGKRGRETRKGAGGGCVSRRRGFALPPDIEPFKTRARNVIVVGRVNRK